jgi:hypothetical protein
VTGELAWWRLWAIGVEITPGRLTRRLAVEPDVGANPLGYIVTQIGKEQLDQRLMRLGCGRFLDPRTYGFDVREDQNSSWRDRDQYGRAETAFIRKVIMSSSAR